MRSQLCAFLRAAAGGSPLPRAGGITGCFDFRITGGRLGQNGKNVVTIGLIVRRLLQIEDVREECRYLERRKAAFGSERGKPIERAQIRGCIDVLGDDQAGALDGTHA
jgi:hypothetical protein